MTRYADGTTVEGKKSKHHTCGHLPIPCLACLPAAPVPVERLAETIPDAQLDAMEAEARKKIPGKSGGGAQWMGPCGDSFLLCELRRTALSLGESAWGYACRARREGRRDDRERSSADPRCAVASEVETDEGAGRESRRFTLYRMRRTTTMTMTRGCSNSVTKPCNDCCGCLSALPEGKTCADCVHVRRCVALFGQKETDTACQFIPSRASLRVVPE